MDMGANIDCKPEHLEQFAYMGHAYVKKVKGIEHPRIALLSNGAEPYKGPALVKKAYDILSNSTLNFVGNLEARDVFEGRADVLVCDGFSGNLLIKAMQGTAYAVRQWLKQERDRSFINRVLFTLSAGIFAGLSDKMSYAQRKGGMLMLGLKAPLIVAHGSSSAQAIENAIHLAYTKVQENFISSFNKEIALIMAQKAIFNTKTINAMHHVR
jgi:glycerol-3-phosphate acyltransferase PlsX